MERSFGRKTNTQTIFCFGEETDITKPPLSLQWRLSWISQNFLSTHTLQTQTNTSEQDTDLNCFADKQRHSFPYIWRKPFNNWFLSSVCTICNFYVQYTNTTMCRIIQPHIWPSSPVCDLCSAPDEDTLSEGVDIVTDSARHEEAHLGIELKVSGTLTTCHRAA